MMEKKEQLYEGKAKKVYATEHRGLSRPRRSDNAHDLAAIDRKADTAQDFVIPE